MKKNPNDNYYTTTNPIVIEDGDTAEQMIFLINAKNRLVIRSLLEEDIKSFVDHYKGVTSKEKGEKRKEESVIRKYPREKFTKLFLLH